jgi:HlyD family secretion protein
MPVGIAGEGGQVGRVLVEPGQWVGAGQTLAVIDRSVQSQEAAQLAAQIEVARADAAARPAGARPRPGAGRRGFVSKADVERRAPPATPPMPASGSPRPISARAAPASAGSTSARPTAGLVLSRNVEAGQIVGAGSGALFRIAAGGEMELLARLPQTDLARSGRRARRR